MDRMEKMAPPNDGDKADYDPFDREAEDAHLKRIDDEGDDEDVIVDDQEDDPAYVAPKGGKGDLPDDDDEEDGDDEDGKKRGPGESPDEKLQARFDRMTAKQRAAEEDRDALAEENEQLRATLRETAQYGANASVEALKGDRDAVKAKLKKAKEDGDTDAEVDLTDELTTLNAKLLAQENAAARLTPRKGEQQPQQRRQQGAPPTGELRFHEAARPWYHANKAWFDDPKNGIERAAVQQLDKDLTAEGYAIESPARYKELDKRLREKMPHLKNSDSDGKRPSQRQEGRQRVGGVSRDSSGSDRPTQKGQTQLTTSDRQTMRRFKLDPDNDAHVKQFYRETRALKS